MKWRFVTEDQCFEEYTGRTRADYLRDFGNKAFREKDIEVVKRMLDCHRTRCVIECGLGSLVTEVQSFLRAYCTTNPVIHIVRDMEQIRGLLRLKDIEARLMDEAEPAHRSCSNFEYHNLYDPNCEIFKEKGYPDRRSPNYSFKLKAAKEDFCSFLHFISGPRSYGHCQTTPFALSAVPVEYRAYTHAVVVRSTQILNHQVDVEELESSEDAVLYKVDRFVDSSLADISRHVASIRRKVQVPIIYEIDRKLLEQDLPNNPQGNRNDIRFGLMLHGLRLGVEFLVVELDDEDDRMRQLIKVKGPTKIIGSHYNSAPDSGAWLSRARYAQYEKTGRLGCDIARIVQLATLATDNDDVREFERHVRAMAGPQLPLIAYNVGELGRNSLLTNSTLTPVKHPSSLCQKGDILDPTITTQEAMQALFDLGTLDPLHFYVFGAGISHSLAPAMHNAAYEMSGLRYEYHRRESSSMDEVLGLANNPYFGGASIGRPFKVDICETLAAKSVHAEAIGAINTLIPLRATSDGKLLRMEDQVAHRGQAAPITALYGDNTDWIGMTTCIVRNLSPRNVIQPAKTSGLVIGAGGMARAAVYAMIKLGCRKVMIYNRTVAKAERIAQHFNSWLLKEGVSGQEVGVLRSSADSWPTNVNLPVIVVSCIFAFSYETESDFRISRQWLSSPTGGLVLEVALCGTMYSFL